MADHRELLQRITARPDVLGGEPCIRGSRVSVAFVLDRLAQGDTPDSIVKHNPDLELEDVQACAAYAEATIASRTPAQVVADRAVNLPPTTSPDGPGPTGRRPSLRELATRSPEEIHHVVQAVGIVMDPAEIAAWDGPWDDDLGD